MKYFVLSCLTVENKISEAVVSDTKEREIKFISVNFKNNAGYSLFYFIE